MARASVAAAWRINMARGAGIGKHHLENHKQRNKNRGAARKAWRSVAASWRNMAASA